MMAEARKVLSDIPAINRFLTYCRVRTVPSKTVIIHAGDTPDTLYYIVGGSVEVMIEDEDGNDITVVVDDDSFDSFATAFGQIVPAGMDEQLVYDIVTAFLAGEERFLTGSPRGPFVRMSFGDIDGVSQGACGAVQIKMHPGAIRAYEDAGHTIADCLRP